MSKNQYLKAIQICKFVFTIHNASFTSLFLVFAVWRSNVDEFFIEISISHGLGLNLEFFDGKTYVITCML